MSVKTNQGLTSMHSMHKQGIIKQSNTKSLDESSFGENIISKNMADDSYMKQWTKY